MQLTVSLERARERRGGGGGGRRVEARKRGRERKR
jgi:hypothetical protein